MSVRYDPMRGGSASITSVKIAERQAAALRQGAREDNAQDVVVRLVETCGEGGEVTVSLPGWVQSADQVNLLERQARSLQIEGGQVRLALRPWEIATLRLSR